MYVKEFVSTQHANQYLSGSLVRVEDEPFIVSDIISDKRTKYAIGYFTSSERGGDTKHIKLNEINSCSVPLGYVLVKSRSACITFYVSRLPSRQWKVGLTRRNMQTRKIWDPRYVVMRSYTPESLLQSDELAKTIKNIFPSYKEVMKMLDKFSIGSSAPFSRNFCVLSTKERDEPVLKLHHKNHIKAVGECKEDGPILYSKYQFLQQVLEKDLKNGS